MSCCILVAAMAGLDSDDDELEQDVPGAANPFSPLSPSMNVPGPLPFQANVGGSPQVTQGNEQRLMQVLESVTLLLQNQIHGSGSSSSSSTLSGKDLAKVLKAPERFSATSREAELAQWPNWSWSFEQWLCCVQREFFQDLRIIRVSMSTPIRMPALTVDEADRSRLMFGILSGMLHEKGQRLLRSIPDCNGFEAYRQLLQDLTPSSRSRLLSLMQMVHSWPPFSPKLGLMVQLSKFEQAVQEYDNLSGTPMSDDAKLAAVLRCLSGQLKMQAMIHITETSTYFDPRRLIERYDSSQAKWSDALASAYGISSSRDAVDTSGPMEIDNVYKGSKGKKGKDGKGKLGKGGKQGTQQQPYQPSRWLEKGKGKGKHEQKGKQAVAMYSNVYNGKGAKLCNFCKKPGHFKRDCYAWKRKQQQMVNNVENASAAASGNQLPLQQGKGKVNRLELCVPDNVPVYCFEDDDRAIDLTVFSLDDEDDGAICSIQKCPEQYDMAADDSDGNWLEDDSPCTNFVACPAVSLASRLSLNSVCPNPNSVCNSHVLRANAIRAVANSDVAGSSDCVEIVVDSGADESCLPSSMSGAGFSVGHDGPSFLDAQGNELSIHDRRTLVLEIPNLQGETKRFNETCLISSVSSPLFAVGKLYKLGWGMFWTDGQFVLGKQGSPETYMPVYFRHNSLIVMGRVRRAQVAPSAKSVDNSSRAMRIRPPVQLRVNMVAQLGPVLKRLLTGATYFQELVPGVWGIQVESDSFIDVHECLPLEGLQYRTTLVRETDGSWKLLEISVDVDRLDNASEPLPGVEAPCMTICLGHREVRSPHELGFEVSGGSEGSVVASGSEPPPRGVDRLPELHDAAEDVEVEGETSGSLPEERQQHAADPARQAVLESYRLDSGDKLADELEVKGVKVRPNDSLKTLREACQLAGIGKSGGKATVYKRLHDFVTRYELQQRAEDIAKDVPANEVKPPVTEPSAEERRLHELTHLPYKDWCLYCQSHKARDNAHKDVDVATKGIPTLSFDFSFTAREEGRDVAKLVGLVVRDDFTGWRECIPVEKRGGKAARTYMAGEIARLCSYLGHPVVKLRCDPEPVCLALRDEVIQRRGKLGLKTLYDQVPEGDHAANGGAESAVHQTRLQAGVLLSMYEARSGCTVETSHPLHSWAFRHASWLLNRFGRRSSGTTPFEDAMQTTYNGKVCPFGSSILALTNSAVKGRARWIQGLWLGKSASSDQHVCCTYGGKLLLTRSVRLLNPCYSASLHTVLKDHSWQHPGLLAGTVGRCVPQKTLPVSDAGQTTAAPTDGAGFVSPLVALPPPQPPRDEAASIPTSPASSASSSTPAKESKMDVEGSQGQVAGGAGPSASSDDLPGLFCSGDEADDGKGVKRDGGADDADVGDERPVKQAREESHKHARVSAVCVEAGERNDEGITPFLESGEVDVLEAYDASFDDLESGHGAEGVHASARGRN